MSVPAAYMGVILIWATTPLAIQWSSVDGGPWFAVTSRMLISALVALLLTRVLRIPVPMHRRALLTYVASGLGIFGGMSFVYWAAQSVPSGWISVLFGLTPIFTGIIAYLWLGDRTLTPIRLLALLVSFAGLGVMFYHSLADAQVAPLGVVAVLMGSLLHGASAVWIKRLDQNLGGWAMTTGGLLVSAPLFITATLLFGDGLPDQLSQRALASIAYLALFGSVLGFVMYYYVLKQTDATRAALITLVTPVLSLWLGHVANGEQVTATVMWGTALILSGLLLFQLPQVRQRKVLQEGPD